MFGIGRQSRFHIESGPHLNRLQPDTEHKPMSKNDAYHGIRLYPQTHERLLQWKKRYTASRGMETMSFDRVIATLLDMSDTYQGWQDMRDEALLAKKRADQDDIIRRAERQAILDLISDRLQKQSDG